MLHVLAPLDADHEAAASALAAGAAAAAGIPPDALAPSHHISLVSITSTPDEPPIGVIEDVAAATPPVLVRAHGYGFFCDGDPGSITVHVPVVVGRALHDLHRALFDALTRAGTTVATWTDPDHWSPHVTLLDRDLDPARLGAAVAWLAGRHHPSWSIRLDRLVVAGPHGDAAAPSTTCALGARRSRSGR